jgi:hypothetical protein
MAGSGARLLAAAALALALGAVEARANHVFTLSGVVFDDNSSATGTFTTDDALTSLLNWDITTADGAITGFHYTPATAPTDFSSISPILVVEDAVPVHILQLTFSGGLTAAGAPITMNDPNGSFEQNNGTKRVVTGGSVAAAVPEPSTLPMGVVAALTGLGVWARRRRAG